MDASDQSVIQTQGLSKAFKGTKALDGLNLKVSKNSIFGFLGPNGAGKSTTIKLLLGLIQPTGGKATVFGQDVQRGSVEIRKRVGYLAQDPRYYEHMTARQTLRYTARFFYRGPKDMIEARVAEMLELVGLEDKADRPIKGFSGGERQRLGIAQAQVNYPDLLILDEPAASLDPMGRRDVLAVMERLRKHTTVFYCTHILDDVQRVSDTVAILNRGTLVANGPIEELLAGGEGIAYTVKIKGDAEGARQRLAGQPWVTGIQTQSRNGSTAWTVAVSDESAAEAQLLRLLLADEHLAVTEFARKQHELEDVFVKIVEGGPDVKRK
ncbi:MAG: ABC transporter ATP-binding protein [Chloroflexi bacterium]|nr:MAG: ABC transporter ATP-binding protein [Chloroflexota bacterium]